MTAVYQLATSLHDGAGNFFQNVFHYQLSEAGSGNSFDYATELISSWITQNETSYLAAIGNEVILDFYSAKKVTAGGGPSATHISATPGSNIQTSSASAYAADIAWITASANNRAGHTFMAGIPTGAVSGGAFSNAYKLEITAIINDLLTQLVLGGALGTADFGVFTRKTGAFNKINHGILRPKPTGMNKRTLPVI